MELVSLIILILWTLASIIILRRIRFFSAAPLQAAPERPSNISLLFFGAVILFYFGLIVIAFIFVKVMVPDNMINLGHAADTPPATVSATAPLDIATLELATIIDSFGRIVTAALAVFAAGRMTVGGIRGFGLDRRKILVGIGLGLLAFFLMSPWMTLLQNIVVHLGQRFRGGPLPVHPVIEMLKTAPNEFRVILMFSAVVVAPIVEEIIFRGLLQTALLQMVDARQAIARWICIGVASVVFTGMHFQNGPSGINWEHFPPLFLLACTLGYLYERTGSLWPSIALHAFFNAFVTAQTLLMIDAK